MEEMKTDLKEEKEGIALREEERNN